MLGDYILCNNCQNIFVDDMPVYNRKLKIQHKKQYDSGKNKKYKNMCPYCHGTNTINVMSIYNKYSKPKRLNDLKCRIKTKDGTTKTINDYKYRLKVMKLITKYRKLSKV